MADIKISELDVASALDGTEHLPFVQGAETVKATAQEIANLKFHIGTLHTADANADNTIIASAAGKKAQVWQFGHGTPTQNLLEGQMFNGDTCWIIQSDGGMIINQRTGATYSKILDVLYANVTQFDVSYNGVAEARVGFNGGGGYFVTDASGNVTALGKVSGNHFLSNGTSPTVDGSNTIDGKDSAFKVTVVGTPSSIVVTFGTVWTTAPVVTGSGSTTGALACVSTTTTATFTKPGGGNFTNTEVLHVVCIGF